MKSSVASAEDGTRRSIVAAANAPGARKKRKKRKMNNYAIDFRPYGFDEEAIWQTHCGVRGLYTKYQEEYRVLGNQRRVVALHARYSLFRDRSYEANARTVSILLIGLYVR